MKIAENTVNAKVDSVRLEMAQFDKNVNSFEAVAQSMKNNNENTLNLPDSGKLSPENRMASDVPYSNGIRKDSSELSGYNPLSTINVGQQATDS